MSKRGSENECVCSWLRECLIVNVFERCVFECVCEGDCVHDHIVLLFLNKLWSENLKDGKWEMGVARQARDN